MFTRFLLLVFIFPFLVFSQEVTLSGYVYDKSTGEHIIGANVIDPNLNIGTATNTYGFYSLTIPSNFAQIQVSFIGYKPIEKEINSNKNIELNFELETSAELLQSVEVTATENIQKQVQMSAIDIPIKQIQAIPALLGEVDVLKALQLLPGVQSGNEGTSGLYVRGGGPDQNLILLDGVPVYNASHLFGFFSVFNADAIKNVKLTKGGYPARFGGRLSSILEIDLKEGNLKEFKGQASIGLIASKLTLEGPIKKGKTSYIISARRTYIDVLAQPIILAASNGGTAGYYFSDINTKINHKFSNKDRLYLSLYTGNDRFYFRGKETFDNFEDRYRFSLGWGNITSSLRWNHQYNPKLFSNLTTTFTRYRFYVDIEEEFTETIGNDTYNERFLLEYYSNIKDWGSKIDFDFIPNPNHYIRFGGSYTYHTFKPGAIHFQEELTNETPLDTTIVNSEELNAHETYFYIEDEINISNRLKINIGSHISGFWVKDSFYPSIQPRVSSRFLLTDQLSLKASYAAMTQYLHLLTNSNIGLPTDLWVPATDKVPPQRSQQVSVGIAQTLAKNKLELTLEGYYKKMDNLIEFVDGATFLGLSDWQDLVETGGEGWAYGLEFFLQKKVGKLSGWIGYTLAWSNRKFAEINFGEEYPYKYDRRHDLSIVASYEFNHKVDVSATWVYGTGNAITMPIATFPGFEYYKGHNLTDFQYYGGKNSYRMNPYHRLDVSINFKKNKKRVDQVWSVGLYNAYNRKNPFFIYFAREYQDNTGAYTNQARQVSIFPVIPSISYSFKF